MSTIGANVQPMPTARASRAATAWPCSMLSGSHDAAIAMSLHKPDACLIPEPGWALYTAEVGVVWAWVTVTGRPVHVREMHAGVNAIEAANAIAAAFKGYEEIVALARGKKLIGKTAMAGGAW